MGEKIAHGMMKEHFTTSVTEQIETQEEIGEVTNEAGWWRPLQLQRKFTKKEKLERQKKG